VSMVLRSTSMRSELGNSKELGTRCLGEFLADQMLNSPRSVEHTMRPFFAPQVSAHCIVKRAH
jgi:hypothetical protein